MIQVTITTLFEIIGAITFALLIGHFLAWAVLKISRRAGVSQSQRTTINRWVRGVMLLLASIAILNLIGLGSEAELLTFTGICALVIGIALQDVFANIFAGLLTFKEDTLRVGDLVEVGSGAGKGRVVRVGLRNVWIETEKGAIIVLDHSTLGNGRYWNFTAVERLKKEFNT